MSCNVLPIVDFLYPKRVDKTDLSFSHPMSYPKRFEFFSLSCNTLIMIAHFSFSKTKKIGKKKKKKTIHRTQRQRPNTNGLVLGFPPSPVKFILKKFETNNGNKTTAGRGPDDLTVLTSLE